MYDICSVILKKKKLHIATIIHSLYKFLNVILERHMKSVLFLKIIFDGS